MEESLARYLLSFAEFIYSDFFFVKKNASQNIGTSSKRFVDAKFSPYNTKLQ